jgi:hypothetical protein
MESPREITYSINAISDLPKLAFLDILTKQLGGMLASLRSLLLQVYRSATIRILTVSHFGSIPNLYLRKRSWLKC